MNKDRRNRIDKVLEQLEEIKNEIESIKDEEDDALI